MIFIATFIIHKLQSHRTDGHSDVINFDNQFLFLPLFINFLSRLMAIHQLQTTTVCNLYCIISYASVSSNMHAYRWNPFIHMILVTGQGYTSHSTHKRSFCRRYLTNLLAWYGKTKPNSTKAHIHQSKEMYYNTKKLKPRLVDSYDIRPGNGVGLFWFRCFINLLLTYLLTYSDTYSHLQSRTHMGLIHVIYLLADYLTISTPACYFSYIHCQNMFARKRQYSYSLSRVRLIWVSGSSRYLAVLFGIHINQHSF